MVILYIIALIIFLIILFGFKIVPASKIAIIEHLGAYNRTIDEPGLILIKPFVEKMHLIDRLTTIEVKNAKISINGNQDYDFTFELTFEVLQPKEYYYLQKESKKSIKESFLKETRMFLEEHQVYGILETKKDLKAYLIDFIQKHEDLFYIQFKSLDIIALNKIK